MKLTDHNKKVIRAYVMIFFAAIIYTVGVQGFIQVAKVFSAGLGAFAQLPTLLAPDTLGDYFSLFYLAFNLPLIILFWKKNKSKFMVRTLFFLVIQTGMGALFFIPEVKNIFSNLLNLDESQHGAATVIINKWPVIVLAVFGSVFVGSSIALSWKYGGSTGGTDIIAYYYSTKKQKSVGSVMFMLSMAIIVFSFSLTVALNPKSTADPDGMRSHWLVSIAGSMSYIMISSLLIDKIYPKFKKVEARIVSHKWKEIEAELEKAGYNHSWRTSEFVSRKGEKSRELTTVAFWLETKDLVKLVQKIDKDAWISLNEVRAVIGRFNAPKLEH